ncbi:MAG: serine hydroxymethyltransferase, partial [Flavobacteriales bacterium]
QVLSEVLVNRGLKITTGGTDCHLMVVDLTPLETLTGKEAEKALMDADITVNKNMIPFDEQSPFITSGIRIGAPAITTRGLKEQDMSLVADFIDRALMAANDDLALEELAEEINAWMGAFPLFA